MSFVIGIVRESVWLCGLPPGVLCEPQGMAAKVGGFFCCRRMGGDFCVMNPVVNSCVSFEPARAILVRKEANIGDYD